MILASTLITRKRRANYTPGEHKKIRKIKVEINRLENKNCRENVMKSKSWFLEKIHSIDDYLARLIRGEGRRKKLLMSGMK